MRTLETWAGSHVGIELAHQVVKGWKRRAQRAERQLEKIRKLKSPKPESLEYQLTFILARHVGERFENQQHGEGAVEVLERIISERNKAMEILALDRRKRDF